MSGALLDLNESSFDAQVKTGITIVDFWAPWCGPCKMQTPILERLAPKIAGQATIAKVNVDESPALAARFSVRSIPTIIILKDGTPIQQFVGVQQEAKLQAAIESA